MVKNSDFCEYMRPPIDRFRTLQFGSFDEIKAIQYLTRKIGYVQKQLVSIKQEVGYNYGKILFDTWIKHGGSIEKFLYRKMVKTTSFGNVRDLTLLD